MPTALAISPHLDDAAFSVGGTLSWLVARGWRVKIATCFTRSVPDPTGFALACQLDKGLGPDVDYMALRRVEDAEACAAVGLDPPIWLDLPEAPHRGYDSASALFGDVRRDDAVEAALVRLLAPHTKQADMVLAPQAIGGHVDHLLTVAAVDRLSNRPPVMWWSDLPYAARVGSRRPLAPRFAALEEVQPQIQHYVKAKLTVCGCYRSQLPFQFPGGAEMMRDLLGIELLCGDPKTSRFFDVRVPETEQSVCPPAS